VQVYLQSWSVRRSSLILAMVVCGGGMAQTAWASQISGLRLLVADSVGNPIEGAEVRVAGTRINGLSGPDGRVVFADALPERVVVTIRAVGFVPDTLVVSAEDAGQVIRITLVRQVTRLPDVEAAGRLPMPTEYRRIIRMEGFYRRMNLNLGGQFITPEEVQASNSVSVERLLGERAILGLRNGREFVGCPRNKVGIWIDGRKVGSDGLQLHTRDVEAVEVYRRAVQIPAEFLDDSCAAIVIWTSVP